MNQILPTMDGQNKANGNEHIEYFFANKKFKSIVPKMDYMKYEQDDVGKPDYRLVLEHVVGYMGYDNLCRNNMFKIANNSLVYNVGCLAVIHDLHSNQQRI